MQEIKPTGGKGRRLTFRQLKTEKGIRESRMTIWRRIREGQFPEPFEDHGRSYWWEDEIDQHNAKLESLPRGPGRSPPPKRKTTLRQNIAKQEAGE